MKRSYIKQVSNKRRLRNAEVKPFRDSLVKRVGCCEICGCKPGDRKPVKQLSNLCCHEIANGPNRDKALDKAFAILVLCWGCNGDKVEDKGQWPESRQLAVLKSSRPEDFDLAAYNFLINPNAPNRITTEEVDVWFSIN